MQMNSELIILCHLHPGNSSNATEIYTCYQLKSYKIVSNHACATGLHGLQCCLYMQPHRVLTVCMTGQPDIFFGSRDWSHLFLGLEKICVFWGFTNIQANFFCCHQWIRKLFNWIFIQQCVSTREDEETSVDIPIIIILLAYWCRIMH